MTAQNSVPSLPSAAEMAGCFRDPGRKGELQSRIEAHYFHLRSQVCRPGKKDSLLIKKYSQIMAELRLEEETLMEMLDSFARGDAESVREVSAKLTGVIQNREKTAKGTL